ncbi:site-2 protease family protein [Goodfellowiella coeruleoviolacea]|uniref:Zn-dependent protease (Includes SpoIVFB) n=1 Tax=Goodfellowiella coeruleoviolacea TaxID=334858 RepID=A0AAE3GHW8_9PSEU|nr:site-2 protease family protein [Goodfellowiella coeruleoviolacea]MCP2167943.1 Zn-dependent protease (includes SpoIVFB) [Goodfellowiella coeruleoviolacea]
MNRSSVLPSPLFLGLLAVTVLGGVLATFDTNDTALVAGTVLLVLGGWAVSLCLHEFGHAAVAYRGGDRAVRAKGYLSLDIRHYTDPVLSLLLPLVLLAAGGIPLPGGAVWINHYALRSRTVESWVSLAGPLINLALGVLLTLSVSLVPMNPGLAGGLSYLAMLQIFAFVLNILPVPGLDGWGALEPYLSAPAREFGAKARPWAPLVLFALMLGLPVVGALFRDIATYLFDAIGGEELLVYYGQINFRFWER